MTSGAFTSLSIGAINANRSERQRRSLQNIDVLADSIRRLGLIHPIVIDRENNLVAGERRLTACRTLGWTHINCQYVDELDPLLAHAIELEENVKREALPWQDEAKAVAEYHALRASQEEDWTQERTAEALGLSPMTVTDKLRVARELESGNEMVTNAPRFSTARGIVRRAESRRSEADALAILGGAKPEAPTAASGPIINADFNEWAATYTGPKFNFIHCDFPYGINADKFNQGAATLHGGYADTEDTYWELCTTLVAYLDRLAAPSAHFMFWFSMHYYTETLEFFEKNTDIKFDPFPLVWTKSDNIGIIPDPERGPRRIYETCLFGSRGDRKIVRPTSNADYSPSTRDEHMSIKSEAMLRKFFGMFVDSSTSFLDPTCGSGSSVRAANGIGAARVVGIEANSQFAERANINFIKGLNNADNASGTNKNQERKLEDNGPELAAG
jgi:ParB/RepB/Spo0J family partition protein